MFQNWFTSELQSINDAPDVVGELYRTGPESAQKMKLQFETAD